MLALRSADVHAAAASLDDAAALHTAACHEHALCHDAQACKPALSDSKLASLTGP